MSYNTRNTRNNYTTASPVGNIGQRRPQQGTPQQQPQQTAPVQNNFVAGGQLKPQQHPIVQMPVTPQQQQRPQQAATPQLQARPLSQQTPQQVAPQLKQEPKIVFKSSEGVEGDATDMETQVTTIIGEDGKPKKIWPKRTKEGKVSKAEKVRRLNQRLKKIITPKNAPMVLNEIVGNTPFEISEIPNNMGVTCFMAKVVVDGSEHSGRGKTKGMAKAAAAEAAIKAFVMHKMPTGLLAPPPTNNGAEKKEDGGEGMDVDKTDEEKQAEDNSLAWSQLASFALHKLFSTWEDPSTGQTFEGLTRSMSSNSLAASRKTQQDMRPSKKMPPNAVEMNPAMLLNQMHPEAVYEDVCKVGTPPNVNFTIKCTVGDRPFIGNGPTKKLAKKDAAFRACRDMLSINYPAEVFDANAMLQSPPKKEFPPTPNNQQSAMQSQSFKWMRYTSNETDNSSVNY